MGKRKSAERRSPASVQLKIWVPKTFKRALKAEALEREMSMASIIQEAIESRMVLTRAQPALPMLTRPIGLNAPTAVENSVRPALPGQGERHVVGAELARNLPGEKP